jgi:hypothetical protein
MNEMSTEADGADAAPGRRQAGEDTASAPPQDIDGEALSAADYCHLAEECFFLAAVENDPDAAAKLVETGNDYLRRVAEWFAGQLRR